MWVCGASGSAFRLALCLHGGEQCIVTCVQGKRSAASVFICCIGPGVEMQSFPLEAGAAEPDEDPATRQCLPATAGLQP